MRRARLILLAGTVLYSAWMIAPLLGSRLSPLTSYVSEAGAVGQPNALFFRAADLLAGTAFVVAGALCHLALRPVPKLGLVALAGLFILGIATMCDALMPLSCTPTADAACAAREAARQVPLTHVGHAVSSGIAGFGGVVAVLGWGLWRRSTGTGFDGARLLLGMGVTYLLATTWTLAAMLEPALYLGLAQRTQVLSLTLWLVLLATAPRPRGRRPEGRHPAGRDTSRSPRPPATTAGPSRPDRPDG
ncbi:DUF998 domain-containing protein [Tsukamurella paurometabola]|uniref:DUF998 domain-containing protein n=1 Tax=Tsukamurella paurometabola TaxID=2061 RepID=UPI0027BAABF5|nr:DUF998 domain-containing protein [Tsukamurella paurometabola]